MAVPSLALWAIAVAVAELMPVPTQHGIELSLGFPLLFAIMMIFQPLVASTVAFVGAFDRRELRRSVPLSTALFNRSQIAVSVMAGSAAFHVINDPASWVWLLLAVVAARLADYLVNMALVTTVIRLRSGISLRSALRLLRVGSPAEYLLNYLGLSLIGVVIFELYRPYATDHNLWAVAAFVAPLIFARQMFLRTLALQEATAELKDRERVLRALSNRMAEERQDERQQIADYLHDDLAQTLFQLTLRLEMAKKRLDRGDLEGVDRDLDQLRDIKQRASDMVRSLVRDLHAVPIGRTGLADALVTMAEDLSANDTVVAADAVQVEVPPPIQLLIYQIAREAVTNAIKHADPDHVWVTLRGTPEGVDLTIRDDGSGFDAAAAPPEGHFGMVMMRERAQVAGGTFTVASEPGRGTTVTAHFPPVWLEEAAREAREAERGAGEPERTDAEPAGSVTALERPPLTLEASGPPPARPAASAQGGSPFPALPPPGPTPRRRRTGRRPH
jgi:signal transduction histidine kinase